MELTHNIRKCAKFKFVFLKMLKMKQDLFLFKFFLNVSRTKEYFVYQNAKPIQEIYHRKIVLH